MTCVELHHVVKTFDNAACALDDVNLKIEPGEFLVVVGPSGCGKSTLLRVIAGLEQVTSGEIYFDGQPVTTTLPQHRDVGMVFQNYALYPHLTVAENLAFPLKVRKVPRQEQQRRIREVAALLGLEALLDRLPKQLSGGQQQRVAVGRALVRAPRVFLFDEPLSNLDANLRIAMRTELAALQRRVGITTLYVTHDHTEAMTMGDRIAVMKGGRIVQIGTPEQLYTNPEDLFVATFLGTPPINIIDGTLSATENALCFGAQKAGLRLTVPPSAVRTAPARSEQAAVLAVRPEHVALTQQDAADGVGIVDMVEYIGHEQIVHVQLGESSITLRVNGTETVSRNEQIGIRFDRQRLLLFEPSGRRL